MEEAILPEIFIQFFVNSNPTQIFTLQVSRNLTQTLIVITNQCHRQSKRSEGALAKNREH